MRSSSPSILASYFFEKNGKRSTSRSSRSALRLSVRHFDLFRFSVPEIDHTGVSALGAEQREVLQHRVRPYLRSRLAAASGAAEPVRSGWQGLRHFLSPARSSGPSPGPFSNTSFNMHHMMRIAYYTGKRRIVNRVQSDLSAGAPRGKDAPSLTEHTRDPKRAARFLPIPSFPPAPPGSHPGTPAPNGNGSVPRRISANCWR